MVAIQTQKSQDCFAKRGRVYFPLLACFLKYVQSLWILLFAFHSPTISAAGRMRYCNFNYFTTTSSSSKPGPVAFRRVLCKAIAGLGKLSKGIILTYAGPTCGMKRQGEPTVIVLVPPFAREAGAGAQGCKEHSAPCPSGQVPGGGAGASPTVLLASWFDLILLLGSCAWHQLWPESDCI